MAGMRLASSLSPCRDSENISGRRESQNGKLEGISVHFHQSFYFTEHEAKAQMRCDLLKVTGSKAKPVLLLHWHMAA